MSLGAKGLRQLGDSLQDSSNWGNRHSRAGLAKPLDRKTFAAFCGIPSPEIRACTHRDVPRWPTSNMRTERLRLWDPAEVHYRLNPTEENKARRAAESRIEELEAALAALAALRRPREPAD